MKCNNCKNPVSRNDSNCEWCGQKLDLYQNNIEKHPLKILQNNLLDLEVQARKDFSSNFGFQKSRNKGLLGELTETLFGDDDSSSPNPNSSKADRYVYNLQTQVISKFILPSNPDILKELVSLSDSNYKLNKVSFWDDNGSKSDAAKNKLAEAWLLLSKRAKKKLGIKDSIFNINKLFK